MQAYCAYILSTGKGWPTFLLPKASSVYKLRSKAIHQQYRLGVGNLQQVNYGNLLFPLVGCQLLYLKLLVTVMHISNWRKPVSFKWTYIYWLRTARRGRVVVWRSRVQISVWKPAILTEVFVGLLSSSRQILGSTYIKLGHDYLLPYPFQFIIHPIIGRYI
jgi:hypothetical protein